ncbi:MAG: CvpA family protein [Gallionella sp.]
MTGFDLAVIAILLVSLLFGMWRGFLYEVLSLLGWPLAFMLSYRYADVFAQHIPIPVLSHVEGKQEILRVTVAYALVFIAVMIVWGALVWGLTKLLRAIGLGQFDRMLGGLFGVLRGVLVVLVAVWMAGTTDIPERPFWRDAQMSRGAEDVALLTKAWLPDDIAKRIHFRARN